MKRIAEALVECGYAICADEHHLNILVKDEISETWEWNDFMQDTLEGRRQADALIEAFRITTQWIGERGLGHGNYWIAMPEHGNIKVFNEETKRDAELACVRECFEQLEKDDE